MTHLQKTTQPINILCRPGQSVKARIAGAGIRLGDLAAAAGFSGPGLTGYLIGRTRNIHGQIAIARAFRRLTRQRISTADFWGDLWAEANIEKEGAA